MARGRPEPDHPRRGGVPTTRPGHMRRSMLLGAVAAAIALGAGSAPPATGASAVGVGAHEYYYVLSRQHVSAGHVTVQLYNGGEDPHNLKIVNRNGFEFRVGRAAKAEALGQLREEVGAAGAHVDIPAEEERSVPRPFDRDLGRRQDLLGGQAAVGAGVEVAHREPATRAPDRPDPRQRHGPPL